MSSEFHRPVLVREVCEALVPALVLAEAPVFVDCTCGGAGHTLAVLEAYAAARPDGPKLRAIAFDRDAEALAEARTRLPGDVELVHSSFGRLPEVLDELGVAAATAILADLGVSSHQLDTGARGFSFQVDAPLDMRMDPSRGAPASQLLAEIGAGELTQVLRDYGEEPDAGRIAAAIVAARPTTTGMLARVVAAAMSAPQRRKLGLRIHPATRTFQALRIRVNDELGELERLLSAAPERLQVGGRLGIITFHSLEDRATKQSFTALTRAEQPPPGLPIAARDLPRPRFVVPAGYRQGAAPGDAEIAANPRSRSSRLRVVERALP
ncbi:16S rRNA (cytosine(1402)-N(4))-methyltransferase RsmH [Nannocystis sp. SCPEA4]|uniref:16S rRNA (cytosine(1402)-N(4))-methyltransferase RsmH n=1 Tax=Nannocystis sp. SCPEA4 TaxID=2996787 RepID=UPI00226D5C9E|nr:16S rRNA (cytosine(1402)-N(4))-methyltransferase RsmH [Nannocystis sp. SCPEA4]MCY1055033.1 16S rRNA (cytosine(1402)-N(4))-methyltransferase RsmH [Nannocystis sp. SCPEA4]